MPFLDDELQFNKDYLNALKEAQLEMAKGGGAKKVKKGDFYVEYNSPKALADEVKRVTTQIYIQENGCPERKLCQ